MASENVTEESPAPVEMDLDSANPDNGAEIVGKRNREDAENGDQNDAVSKKQKLEDNKEENEEKSVEEVRMEKKAVGPISLGPKTFTTSVEMFDYFYKLLHHWPVNFCVNKYEYLALLDLIKKGHPEPDKKIGSGIEAFQVRYHPEWQSRCFFVVRDNKSAEDFSFRKCVDQILPLPENMKIKTDVNKVLGGKGGGKKGGGGGGGGGGGKKGGGGGSGRGGGGRGRGGHSRK